MAEFTGERVVPGQVDPDLLNEHLARYAFAARLCSHKRVLDIGCGMGYGTAELARHSRSATGIDLAAAAVADARQAYPAGNLQYACASCTNLPFADASFDLAVSFEVIEHIAEWREMLVEARRVLRPGGQFIVSTPNRLYYAETRKLAGPNPYHDHEFEFEEFRLALEELFPSVSLFLQNHAAGIVFQPIHPDESAEVTIAGSAIAPDESNFFLAVCALGRQLGAPTFVYLPTTANLLRERELHISRLETELVTKNEWLDSARLEHQELVEMFRRQTEEIRQKNEWAAKLNGEVDAQRQRIAQLQDEVVTQNAEMAKLAAGYEAQRARVEDESRQFVAHAQETELRITAQAEAVIRELEAKCAELASCVDLLHKTEEEAAAQTVWALSLKAETDELKAAVARYQTQVNLARSSRWLKLGRALHVGPEIQEQ